MSLSEAEIKAQEDAKKKEMEETAAALKKSLGLDSILERLDVAEKKVADNVMKVFVANDVKKDVSALTAEEKTKAFAFALYRGDDVSVKALSEGVDADGGYVAPTEFYGSLLQELTAASRFRSLVNVVPMKSKSLTLDIVSNGPDTYWTGEGVTKTTTSAEFSQKVLTAFKLAAIIYLTDELIDDASYDLTTVLIQRFAKSVAEKEDAAIVNGNGTTQPQGLFVATVSSRTVNTPTFDDVIDLIYDLPEEFRPNARFVMNPSQTKNFRKLKDSNGVYLWSPAIAPGQPDTINGYPVVTYSGVPESQVLFGDLKEAYWFGDRQRLTVKITQDTETAFTKDMTAIRVVERVAGLVVFANALRKITGIS